MPRERGNDLPRSHPNPGRGSSAPFPKNVSMSQFSTLAFPVLASVEEVVSRSVFVRFHPRRIGPAIASWGGLLDPVSRWEHPCHFFDGTEESVRWIFTLDVANHCFWPDSGAPAWTVHYGGSAYSGYWGLAAALKRAVELGFPVTDPAWLARMGEKDLAAVFSGEGTIPLFAERLHNLREAGSVILSRLGGDIVTLLDGADGSAVRLVLDLVSLFSSFRDEADYRGRKVYFWKRAQIFAADVFSAFSGQGRGRFHDMERLTAFADYKLPQVLRELGVISYRKELAAAVDGLACLEPGSEREVEIRAMTVWAAEKIREAFAERGQSVTAQAIDNWLWQLGQSDVFRKRPYHRCRTIFY